MTAADFPTPAARRPGAKGTGPARREQIIDAAKQVFLQEGYDHATMRRIAQQVGVSSTALYVYFKDKRDLLLEIADRTFDRHLEMVAEIRGQGQPPGETLRRMLLCYIAFGISHPDEYRLAFLTTDPEEEECNLHDPVIDPSAKGAKGHLAFRALCQQVAEAIAAGALRPEDPVVLTQAVWAAVHGLVTVLIQPSTKLTEPTATAELLVDTLLRGAGAAAP